MDSALILPNEVLIVADLGINFDAIGILIGVYTITAGVSVLVFGFLADILERRKMLIIAGFTWSITVIMYVFVSEFWHLILGRIIAAVAIGVTTPLSISYIADIISPETRSKSFAVWTLITSFAAIIASILALIFNPVDFEAIDPLPIDEKIEFIILNYPEALHNWALPFLYLGVIALILTIINIFTTIEPKRAAKEKYFKEALEQEEVTYKYKIKFSDLKFIYKRKSNLFLILNIFDVIASGLLLSFLFTYIQLDIGINIIDLRILVLILVAGLFGLIVGQFVLAHWGDKKVQKGDLSGRVKIAVLCSILTLPFLLVAFAMTPSVSSSSYFFGTVVVDEVGFWILWVVYSILLGLGLAFTMGIGPNWYASIIDVNYPENRGTMIAFGSFVDTIGRALGSIIGGIMISAIGSISGTIFWTTLIFGLISLAFWIPLLFVSRKDMEEVDRIMKERSETLVPGE